MRDIAFPKDNEKEFIQMAEKLGISELCLVYDSPREAPRIETKVGLSTAVLCKPNEVSRYKAKNTVIVRAPEDPDALRNLIEQQKPHIIFGLESQKRGDFLHHRASGINHVMAALAAEKGVCVGLSFSDALNSRGRRRAEILGRMRQNIEFARKFKFDVRVASFATSPWQMRAEKEITAFFETLGMAGETAKPTERER